MIHLIVGMCGSAPGWAAAMTLHAALTSWTKLEELNGSVWQGPTLGGVRLTLRKAS